MTKTTLLTAIGISLCLPSVGASASQHGALASTPASGTIVTYAGGGVGDGRPATAGVLVDPEGIAFDSSGNLYIADAVERRVRVVRHGIMTTLAGTGDVGTGGDGGPATAATFVVPMGVAVDGAGNVYVSDGGNAGGAPQGSIRRIDTHGVISTLWSEADVVSCASAATASEPCASKLTGGPKGLAVSPDGGTLYVGTDGRVLAISTANGSMSTFAGGPLPEHPGDGDGGPAAQATLNAPYNVAVDGAGDVYIADENNCNVRKVSVDGTITTVLGGGGSSSCTSQDVLGAPIAVAVDHQGRVYVADGGVADANPVVPRVLQILSPGSPGSARVVATGATGMNTMALAVAPGRLGTVYGAARSIVYDVFDVTVVAAGQGGGTVGDRAVSGDAATNIYLNEPSNVVSGPGGQVYVADQTDVIRVDAAGMAGPSAGDGALPPWLGHPLLGSADNPEGHSARGWSLTPAGVATDGNGNVYVGDQYTHRVLRIDPHGTLHDVAGTGDGTGGGVAGGDLGEGRPALSASLSAPVALLWANGVLYINDAGYGLIRRVGRDGIITTLAGGGVPVALAGGLTTSSGGGTCGSQSTADTTKVTGSLRNGVPGDQACLQGPSGLAMDAAGNLYFSEAGLDVVDKLTPSGTLTAVAGIPGLPGYSGDGQAATVATLDNPQGVAVDGAGNLFIADSGNGVVRKVDTSGNVSTVVGSTTGMVWANPGPNVVGGSLDVSQDLNAEGVYSPSRGDGGPPASAYLQDPVAVAVDAHGTLYIADQNDNRIRAVGGIASAHAQRAESTATTSRDVHQRRLNRAW